MLTSLNRDIPPNICIIAYLRITIVIVNTVYYWIHKYIRVWIKGRICYHTCVSSDDY